MHSLASRDNYFVSFWRIRSEAFSLEAGSPARPVRGASPFIVRHLDEQFLLRSGCVRAPRNLITSCGDRIALTKSSKGGVKARAQRENRRRQSPSSWTTFSLQPLLSVSSSFSPSFRATVSSPESHSLSSQFPVFVRVASETGSGRKGKLNFPRIIKNRVLLRDAEWTEMKFAFPLERDAASLAAFFRRNYSPLNSGFNAAKDFVAAERIAPANGTLCRNLVDEHSLRRVDRTA